MKCSVCLELAESTKPLFAKNHTGRMADAPESAHDHVVQSDAMEAFLACS